MKVKLINFSKILIFIILCLILSIYNFDTFISMMLILVYSILYFGNKIKIDYEKLAFQIVIRTVNRNKIKERLTIKVKHKF